VTKRLLMSIAFAIGCSNQGATGDAIPAFTNVQGGVTTVGFTNGHLRATANLASFQITVEPITVHQYKQCVSAGACGAPSLATSTCSNQATTTLRGATYNLDDSLPITCVSVDDATRYCKWQGGQLPSLAEWSLAARGAAPTTYPWGNAPPTCDQHAGGRDANDQPCAKSIADLRTGLHSNGASANDLQDVLLTPGELLRSSADGLFGPCVNGTSGCIVSGFGAGGMDRVATAPRADAKGASPLSVPTFGFRCVKEGQ
jgi:hypothetical protein